MRVDETYDVVESLVSAKADETMIAFAGFLMPGAPGLGGREGVLKVATFDSSKKSGYLTLTFVVDREAGGACRDVRERFARAGEEALQGRLGPDFEMVIEVQLDTFAAFDRFCIEELNLYFRALAGRERVILETQVMPVLAELLDLQFEPLEWVGEVAAGAVGVSLKERLRRRLQDETPSRSASGSRPNER